MIGEDPTKSQGTAPDLPGQPDNAIALYIALTIALLLPFGPQAGLAAIAAVLALRTARAPERILSSHSTIFPSPHG